MTPCRLPPVLIYHWDIDGALRPDRESGLPYHFSLEEADGDGALQRTHDNGGDRGVAGDGFAGDGSIASFTGGSTPSTAFNSGVPSTVTVHSIEIEDGRARIRISTVPSPAPVPGASFPPTGVLSPYEAGIRFGGGALPLSREPDLRRIARRPRDVRGGGPGRRHGNANRERRPRTRVAGLRCPRLHRRRIGRALRGRLLRSHRPPRRAVRGRRADAPWQISKETTSTRLETGTGPTISGIYGHTYRRVAASRDESRRRVAASP